MEYTLYLESQFAELKKPKQNRVKSRKHDFVETFIESSKELRFITAVLEQFSFFFYVFLYISKLKTEIQVRQITSRREGRRHLERT